MIAGIEHIGLCAHDPRSLAEWYIGHLNFRLVKSLEERRTYFIRASNGGMIEIYPAQHPAAVVDNLHQGIRHLALAVADIDSAIAALRSAGIAVPEETIVCTPEMKLAFFRDPDGNLLHFVERKREIP